MASITLSTAPLGYTENSEEIALDAAALFDAAGLSVNSLDGFELSVSFVNGGLPADRLIVGVNAAEGVGLDGRIIRLNNTEVATFSGGIGTEPLVIRFNAAATLSAVQPLLRSLSYVNLSDNLPLTGDRQINFLLGQPQQSPLATASRSIAVTGVDDAPVVYTSLSFYDNLLVQATDSAAAAEGPWLAYQDTINYPQEVPVVGGTTLLGGTASQNLISGGTQLQTDAQAYAGFSNYRPDYSQATVGNILAGDITIPLQLVNGAFPILDRQEGFKLSFSAQLSAEARNGNADKNNDGIDDRAGFSVLVVSSDQKAIELGFWQDEIWAQNDGTSQIDPSLEPDTDPPSDFRSLFTHGEGASFNTTQQTDYDLVVKGDLYQLLANNALLLSGALRDYTSFPVPAQTVNATDFGFPLSIERQINLPDPYETPNFIFLGDNTPTASATVTLSQIALQQPNANPTIDVSSGVVTRLPQIQLGDPDGLEQATVVLLSVPSGNLEVTGNNAVTVTASNLGLVLDGTLAAINALLNDSQNFVYQPAAGATENVPIAIEFEPDLSGQKISAVASDINGDGFSDIVLRNSFSGDNQVQFMNGTETISNSNLGPSIQDENWQIVGTGDFNNDSQTDILWRHRTTGQVLVWYMENGQPQRAELVGRPITESALEIVGTGDFNNDGRTDIVLRNYNTNQNLIWYMNGSQIIQEGGVNLNTLDPLDTAWRIQATADFNDDGQTDILLRNMDPSDQGQNIVWFMNGSEVIGESPIGRDEPDLNWEIAGSADFNDNGQSDILLRNYATGVNLIWFMNGTNIVQETPLLAMLNN